MYRAEQPLLGREAVIKVLHTRHRASKTAIQRFLREAQLASKLDHPYAAHIYAFGVETDGLIWIAMEYVRGQSLHERLRAKGTMSLEELVPLLDRICEVLHAAHELGIVHRDIKPPNVMVVQRSGRLFPKLLDFGVAKLRVDEPAPAPVEVAPAAAPLGETTVSFVGPVGGALAGKLEPRSVPDELARTVDVSMTPAVDGPAPALTEAGATVGSPPYMAPEQWTDSSAATPRTDLYALGITVFEALTGQRPFAGPTLYALAHAHAEAPVPPLGGQFPKALDAVMAKMLAKDPAQRFASALELATAFRTAAGYGAQPLPTFDDELRMTAEATLPQPIAEAVAAFHAARNAHQARDAIRELSTTAIRYVAMIALAAYAQVVPDDPTSAAALAQALRELHRRALSDEEWVAVARAAVEPFRGRRAVHPVPALVDLFAEPTDVLTAVATLRPSELDPLGVTRALVREVARLVRSLAFLAEVPLVVVDGGRAELWTGLRRARRIAIEVRGVELEPGHPLLVDAAHRPLVSLWPLVQSSPPLPDAPPELFVLDGHGRRGARMLALPAPLERHDERVWEWLVERFARDTEPPASSEQGAQSPYRGLAAFTAADADRFVGREQEIDAAVNRLRTSRLLAVVGPSGVGKSSLVHAGIVPALAGWTVITVRPGPTPLATLEARLQRAGLSLATLGETTLLVIDQFEELFTLGASLEERLAYVRALLGSPDVRVIITLRDDFLAPATQLPELRERLAAALFLLGTPPRAQLLRILIEPLAKLGFQFEDPALPERIVREVADSPAALALIAFTAQKLWELRDRQFRQLTRRAYESLGGIAGALGQHAEATLAAMSAGEQRLARIALSHLVTAEGTRAILSRRELAQLLDDHGEAVLEKLIAARLLTATEAESGDDSIELVHEALLVAWPRLAAWRRDDAEGARMRDQLRAAARQWLERGRPRGLLWRDDALAELKVWHARYPGKLTDGDTAFIRASVAEAARGARWRRGILATLVSLLAVAVAVLIYARDQAAEQREAAREAAARDRAQVQAELVDKARKAVLAGRTDEARQALADAERVGVEQTPVLRFLAAAADAPLRARLGTLDGHAREVKSVAFDRTGDRVLTASWDGTARLWDAKTHAALAVFRGCPDKLDTAIFDPAFQRVATSCYDGVVRVYALDGTLQHAFSGERSGAGEHFIRARFTPDGEHLVAAVRDRLSSWNVATGARDWTARSDEEDQRYMAMSRDGTVVATSGQTQTVGVVLWSVKTGEKLRTFPTGYTNSIELSSDGRTLLTTSWDKKSAQLWDVRDGHLIRSLAGHSAWVDQALFSPDGKTIITGSRDHTIRIWNAATGDVVASLFVGSGFVRDLQFASNGTFAAGMSDGSAIVWDAAGTRLSTLAGHREPVTAVAFTGDGARLATASDDRTAMLWASAAGAVEHVLPHPGNVIGAGRDAAHERAYAWGGIGVLRRWNAATGALEQEVHTPSGQQIDAGALRDDGTVLVGDDAGAVYAWDPGAAAVREVVHHAGAIRALVLSPDQRLVATGGDGGEVELAEIATGRVLARLAGHAGHVDAVAFASNAVLATGDDQGQIRVWQASGALVRTLAGHTDWISQLAFLRDGRLVSASADGTARLWSAEGAVVHVFRGHSSLINSVAVDPAELRIATTSVDNTARLWNLATGGSIAVLHHQSFLLCAAFSHDGALLATAGDDATVRIWDAAHGTELLDLEAHTGPIWRLSYEADDRHLVSAGLDSRAIVWKLPGGQ